jgi:putative endonuclease
LDDEEIVKHYCYLLACSDNTLYCGYTNDLNKRIAAHNKGKGAKYTKTRLPVKLAYYEEFATKSEAMKREWQIKQYTRKQKLNLLNDSK